MIKITRVSPFSGKTNEMEIPLTQAEFNKAHFFWIKGAYIQDAFPMLSADHREFILTGITPDEWKATFGEEETP